MEPKKDENRALTIRDSRDVALEYDSLKRYIGSQLKSGTDYGVIPGTQKPSLWKSGAEKLARLFNLGSRIVSQTKDINIEKGYATVAYTFEIFHLKTGVGLSQCEGCATSLEKKYRNVALPDILNTLMKIAQKRAYVGAVIQAIGASDYFTHDIDDVIDAEVIGATQQQPTGDRSKPTDKQLKRLYAIVRSSGWFDEDVKDYMKKEFNKASSKDLTWVEYDKFCTFVESNPVLDSQEDAPG